MSGVSFLKTRTSEMYFVCYDSIYIEINNFGSDLNDVNNIFKGLIPFQLDTVNAQNCWSEKIQFDV